MSEEGKITHQTFHDLSTWLIHPNDYSNDQLSRLINEDKCLPLIKLAHKYWLIGALLNQLKGADVWEKLSDELKNYLSEIEGVYFCRINAIKLETIRVSELLVNANIDVVVIKGAASLFNGVSNPISNRYMKDIDLLVSEDNQSHAEELLRANGYTQDKYYLDVNVKDRHHSPPLIKNNCCYIELHRWALVKHLNKVLETSDIWKKAQPLKINEEILIKQMNPTHQVVLSIAHSELSNAGYDERHLDLHQLFHLYNTITYYNDEIEWDFIFKCFKDIHLENILSSILYSMYRLFNLKTPLTNLTDKGAKTHFEKSLAKFVKKQGEYSTIDLLKQRLYIYKKRNILLNYGNNGRYPYIYGGTKHLFFHVKKAMNVKNLKRLYNDLFKI